MCQAICLSASRWTRSNKMAVSLLALSVGLACPPRLPLWGAKATSPILPEMLFMTHFDTLVS
jgi:hypothetical protein